MTSNRNVKLQFLNKLPKVSVEEQGIEKRREGGTKILKIWEFEKPSHLQTYRQRISSKTL
ncbi:MAG: hypothetical protein Ct9H90mP7_5710 [Candidatus Neomarinimicrobiota bacterium]|nr:MAG: hypothetical protein Ct9H90mP7_5710 [Candidatus Neomarinimicrobiota bacterium]